MNGAYALEFTSIRTQACGGFLFGLLSLFFGQAFLGSRFFLATFSAFLSAFS
jgi:hypothetical protein